MSDTPTTEQKAAAFDAMVKMLQGKHEWIEDKDVHLKRPTSPGSYKAQAAATFKRVPVYRWQFCATDETDVEKVLLSAVKR